MAATAASLGFGLEPKTSEWYFPHPVQRRSPPELYFSSPEPVTFFSAEGAGPSRARGNFPRRASGLPSDCGSRTAPADAPHRMLRLSEPQQDIVKLLRRHGTQTVEDLRRTLGVTAVAVRHHLDVLEAEGMLVSETEPRSAGAGRGRPRRLYRLTDAADDLFPKNYSGLAQTILEHLEASSGAEGVDAVFRARRLRLEGELRGRLEGQDLSARVAAVAELQDRSGYMADWEAEPDGSYLLREHNCAVCKVARRFPQVCENELQLIRNLTGAEVTRERHIAAGDSVCSYRIRPRP